MADTLSIGEVARAAGVGVETLRFYERKGLVPEPPRRPSGYRAYPPDTVRRVRFIRRAKDLGFFLKEIKSLLALRVGGRARCDRVRDQAVGKVADIEAKIQSLTRMRTTLLELIDACATETRTAVCPVLDALDPAEV